jgi:pimeloyl-ACP methyl ester carboxylesterase
VTGFVAIDTTHDEIVISFRGTESRRNLYVDLGYHLMPTDTCKGCEASHGFSLAWNDTRQAVFDVVDEIHKNITGPQKRIVTVGHSMGAAVAGLAASDLRQRGYVTDMVCIVFSG